MGYSLVITERADELLDEIVYYLLYQLKNQQAAEHLLTNIDRVYTRLQENPYQFPESRDRFLRQMNYREAILSEMKYVIFFRFENRTVYVVGIFHQLEDYPRKM